MKTDFPSNLADAREFQKKIAEKIILKDAELDIKLVGALDVAYKERKGFAAGIVYDVAEKQIIEKQIFSDVVLFPYIPTFLFLREVPLFLKLIELFNSEPDIFLIDGHGVAHPKFAGSATVFSVLCDKPAIGIAKKPLRPFRYQDTTDNTIKKIIVNEKQVGIRYKPNKNWKPIFISPGNKISIETSFELVKATLTQKQKLPYPLHVAHLAAAEAKQA